jgi:hypothetical protein
MIEIKGRGAPPAFGVLPIEARTAIHGRMWDIFSGRDTSRKYAHVSEADRRAVLEILRDTLHDLPTDFRASALSPHEK